LKDMEDSMKQAEKEAHSEQEKLNARAKKERSALERRVSELEAELKEAKEMINVSTSPSRRKFAPPPPDGMKSRQVHSASSSSQMRVSGSKQAKQWPRVETSDEESPIGPIAANVPSDSDREEDPIPPPKPQSRPRPKPRPIPKPVSRPRSPEVQEVTSDNNEVEVPSPKSKSLKSHGKRKADQVDSGSEASSNVVRPAKMSSRQVGNAPGGSRTILPKKRPLGGGLATLYGPSSFTTYDSMFSNLSPATATVSSLNKDGARKYKR